MKKITTGGQFLHLLNEFVVIWQHSSGIHFVVKGDSKVEDWITDTDIHPSKNDLVPEAVYLVDWTGPTDHAILGTGHHGSSCWSCAMC